MEGSNNAVNYASWFSSSTRETLSFLISGKMLRKICVSSSATARGILCLTSTVANLRSARITYMKWKTFLVPRSLLLLCVRQERNEPFNVLFPLMSTGHITAAGRVVKAVGMVQNESNRKINLPPGFLKFCAIRSSTLSLPPSSLSAPRRQHLLPRQNHYDQCPN